MDQFFSSNETNDSPLYAIYPKDKLNNIFSAKEQSYYRNRRLKKGIKSKAIYTWKEGHRESDSMGQRLQIDGEKYPITCDISVYQDRVRVTILGEERLSAILVESKEFSETLKSLFNFAFDKQKK